jgi:hypothetical protein
MDIILPKSIKFASIHLVNHWWIFVLQWYGPPTRPFQATNISPTNTNSISSLYQGLSMVQHSSYVIKELLVEACTAPGPDTGNWKQLCMQMDESFRRDWMCGNLKGISAVVILRGVRNMNEFNTFGQCF